MGKDRLQCPSPFHSHQSNLSLYDIYGQGHASLPSQNEEAAASCASCYRCNEELKAEGNGEQVTAVVVVMVDTPCECCTTDNQVFSTSHINFGLGSTELPAVTLQHA